MLSSLRCNDIDTDQEALGCIAMSLDDSASVSVLRRYPDPQQQSITGPPRTPSVATVTISAASPKQLQELQVAAVTAASRAAILEEELGALRAELLAERTRAEALESKITVLTVQLVSRWGKDGCRNEINPLLTLHLPAYPPPQYPFRAHPWRPTTSSRISSTACYLWVWILATSLLLGLRQSGVPRSLSLHPLPQERTTSGKSIIKPGG